MFLSDLYSARIVILRILLPFFLLAGINSGSGSQSSTNSNQSPKESIIPDLPSGSIYSSTYHNSENKPAPNTRVIIYLSLPESSTELYRPAFYGGIIRNESIGNFRLRSFITSHFATST